MGKFWKWFVDGRKLKFFLIGAPTTVVVAWACKQMCLDQNLQTTIVTGLMAQVGIMIGGQAVSDSMTGGKTSGHVKETPAEPPKE